MVKPSINPEGAKKDAMNKEAKGKEAYLPAFAVISLGTDLPLKKDEPLDEVATISVINRPRKLGICLCMSMLVTLLLIIGLAVAMLFGHGKYSFRCGVGYDNDFPEQNFQDSEGHHPAAPNNTLHEEVEVDPYKGYEQIEIPEQDYCERLTILNDFIMNMTAYRLHRSMICYITWLDKDIVMSPSEFIEKANENPEFLTEHYETVHETYRAVLPELPSVDKDHGFGDYIPILCDGVDSYWIEKIPADELEAWEAFWADQYPEGAEEDDDDDGEPPAPPQPEHRRRRDADNAGGVDKFRVFAGKLVQAKVYKPEFVKTKAALDKIAS